ncbi:MAG: hypothetical protein HKO65_13575 [Gemmatimonadetes bacterium]|nr:hypothetical protein [Gemmatimonadota bacterium]
MPRFPVFALVAGVLYTLLAGSAAAQQPVPTPESVIGFAIGDDFKLASYE